MQDEIQHVLAFWEDGHCSLMRSYVLLLKAGFDPSILLKMEITKRRTQLKTNIHKAERVVRVVVGLGLVSLAFWGPTNMWFLIGLVPVATGVLGWCPPYSLLGINTCKIGQKPTV